MLPIAGGILLVLGALMYLYLGAVMVSGGTAWSSLTAGYSNILTACGAIVLIFGIIALLGGIFAIMRKFWALALIGGILAIPTVLGLIGMILVAVSHKDFD
jgi:hypothetical protein